MKYTADIVIRDGPRVLMIVRDKNPYKGHYALPGGHVDGDETAAQACVRETREELTVDVAENQLRVVGTYGAEGRDPRGPYTTTAFLYTGPCPTSFAAGDDAAEARWVTYDAIQSGAVAVAFDHRRIIADAFRME